MAIAFTGIAIQSSGTALTESNQIAEFAKNSPQELVSHDCYVALFYKLLTKLACTEHLKLHFFFIAAAFIANGCTTVATIY